MRNLKWILQNRFVLSVLFGTNISFGNFMRESKIMTDYDSVAMILAVISPLNITSQRSFLNREKLVSDYLVTAPHNWSQSKLADRGRRNLLVCLFSSKKAGDSKAFFCCFQVLYLRFGSCIRSF